MPPRSLSEVWAESVVQPVTVVQAAQVSAAPAAREALEDKAAPVATAVEASLRQI
jgi:hypothetical protein